MMFADRVGTLREEVGPWWTASGCPPTAGLVTPLTYTFARYLL